MSDATAGGRKPYVKPTVERVDVVETEIALAGCKNALVGTRHSTPNNSGGGNNKCSSTCKTSSPT